MRDKRDKRDPRDKRDQRDPWGFVHLSSRRSRHALFFTMIPTTRSTIDVCGKQFRAHQVLEPVRTEFARKIRELARDDHPRFRLPGPNPVSIERAHFPALRSAEYVVSEKTDGVRFVLSCFAYNDLKIVSITDRAANVYLFPLRKVPRALFQGTLVDGELAWNKKEKAFAFVAFDAVALAGVTVSHTSLYDRVIAMKKAFETHAPHADDPASFEIKSFVPLKLTAMIEPFLRDAAAKYDVDGVILTPAHEGVKYGRHFGLFKMKTKGRHTVDFKCDTEGRLSVYDPSSSGHVVVGQLIVGIPSEESIVECSHMSGGDPEVKYWKLEGVRKDKTTANDILTYKKTMLNMRENVTLRDLQDALVQ